MPLVISRDCLYNLDTFVLRMRFKAGSSCQLISSKFMPAFERSHECPGQQKGTGRERILARELLAAYASELDFLQKRWRRPRQWTSTLRSPCRSRNPWLPPSRRRSLCRCDRHRRGRLPDQSGPACLHSVLHHQRGGHHHEASAPGRRRLWSVETELLYGDELLSNGQPISDGMVAMRRDINERIKLDEVSIGISGQIVNLTDGTSNCGGQKAMIRKPTQILSKSIWGCCRVCTSAAWSRRATSKSPPPTWWSPARARHRRPRTDPALRDYQPLHGVSDRWLYGERQNPLLPPGSSLGGVRAAIGF